MRLLVYTDYAYRADADGVSGERAFVLFVSELRHAVEELVLCGRLDPRPGRSHYPLAPGIRFVGLPHYASLTRPRDVAAALGGSLRRFWRALDDVDTVWLLGPYVTSLAFVALAALRRRRVVLGVRQDLPTYTRRRHPGRRWLHWAADVLEAAWRTLARRLPIVVVGPELARHYAHGRAVLPIAVSLVRRDELADPAGLRAPAATQPWTLLSVGRLDREKNPLLLADIVAGLAADGEWRLVVCGDGPLLEPLRARLRELGVDRLVDLRGYVPIQDGLLDAYRGADAFLHVSWTEGFPQVIVEAFAAGLPVVATAVGGVPDAVGDAGLLVPPGDAPAAIAALRRLRDEPTLHERLARAGLGRVRARTLESEAGRVAAFLSDPHAPGAGPGRGWD